MLTMEILDLPPRLLEAMQGEMEARLFYNELVKLAQDQEDKDIITRFMKDERKHYNSFYNLYMNLTGYAPVVPIKETPAIDGYVEGIKKAIMDETDAYEFYRDIYMGTQNPAVTHVCFEAMTDENEHAIRLNYLYTKNK